MSIPWSAPEVIAEQTAGTIASEVWSLGATVYSLLAGHSPFERRDRGQNTKEQLRRRIARATYTDIARTDVPASLQAVLARSMSRDPARSGTPRRAISPRRCAACRPSSASRPRRWRSPLTSGRRPRSPSTSPTPSCAGPRAAGVERDDRARRGRARAWRGSRVTRTPNSPVPSAHRRVLPWVIAAAIAAVVAAGGIVTALLATGVL